MFLKREKECEYPFFSWPGQFPSQLLRSTGEYASRDTGSKGHKAADISCDLVYASPGRFSKRKHAHGNAKLVEQDPIFPGKEQRPTRAKLYKHQQGR